MKIVTWNVNSVRARMSLLLDWLADHDPDILCLQETKVVDDLFPAEPLEDAGYNIEFTGQKSYNGVATLSKYPMEGVIKALPGDGDSEPKRILGCIVKDTVVFNLYVPNGREVDHEQYHYKLAWLKRMRKLLDDEFSADEKVIVTGDFNITFDDRDVHNPDVRREKIHCSTPEREAMAHLMDFGLGDGLRKHHEEEGIYTWWSHRERGFEKNQGLRIDHFLLSEPSLEICEDVLVDTKSREGKGTSDHAPVIALFRD